MIESLSIYSSPDCENRSLGAGIAAGAAAGLLWPCSLLEPGAGAAAGFLRHQTQRLVAAQRYIFLSLRIGTPE